MLDQTVDSPQDVTAATAPEQTRTLPVNPSDKYIWGIYGALCFFSIIELYSASSREIAAAGVYGPILRHAAMLFVGFLIILAVERIPYRWFIPLTPLFVIVSVVMMVYVMFFGEIINGARRSFNLPGFAVQPAEFIKLSAVLLLALIMSRTQMKRGILNSGVIASAVAVVFFGALLFNQGLTNTLLLMCISGAMMIIGGIQWRKLGVVVVVYAIVAGGAALYKFGHDSDDDAPPTQAAGTTALTADALVSEASKVNRSGTWQSRLERYFGDSIPLYDKPIDAKNRQEMYSYMAQANGGVFGVIPGNSRETARLPLAFSDYIFAIIIEDLGLVGSMFIMFLYLSLLARAASIARRCTRTFPALLVIGMAVMITFQALFHMAIVSGVFPVSGQPLPLFSKGGTSILITSIAFGIMLSVSRYAVRSDNKKAIRQEIDSLPENMRSENQTQF